MKKGFTLVEMMTVLAILAILALLISPIIGREMREATSTLYQKQIESIKDAAATYASDHIKSLPEEEGEIYKITLQDLQDGGYIKGKLKNPKTKKEFPSTLEIQIVKKQNQYHYIVMEK